MVHNRTESPERLVGRQRVAEYMKHAMHEEISRRTSGSVQLESLLQGVLYGIRDYSALQVLRVMRALGLGKSVEQEVGRRMRDMKPEDIPQLAEIYRKVTIDPRDLDSFNENGGIFQPLDEDALMRAYNHDRHLHHVMTEPDGRVVAGVDYLLPPCETSEYLDYRDTIFDPVYNEHLKPEHRAFIRANLNRIAWIHDLVVDPDCKPMGAGHGCFKFALNRLFHDRGLPYAMCEVWKAAYPGESMTSTSINLPSRMVVEAHSKGANIGVVPLRMTLDGTELDIDRCVYVFNLAKLAEKGII